MKNKNYQGIDKIFLITAFLFCLGTFIVLHEFFDKNINNLSTEILAGVVGAIITTASMLIMFRLQANQEKEKEFSSRIFEKKLQIYQELLLSIFCMDDDQIISPKEIIDIENKIGVACLVAGEKLVMILTQFMIELKLFGKIYARNLNNKQKEMFINFMKNNAQWHLKHECKELPIENLSNDSIEKYYVSLDDLVDEIREDLGVVDGRIRETIGYFINTKYNEYSLIESPNIEITGY
ncbi:MAG: hypothetical protein WBE39_00865 [Candidatus Competibacter sp.]